MAPQPTPDDLPQSPADRFRDHIDGIIRRAFDLGVKHGKSQQARDTLIACWCALTLFFFGIIIGWLL